MSGLLGDQGDVSCALLPLPHPVSPRTSCLRGFVWARAPPGGWGQVLDTGSSVCIQHLLQSQRGQGDLPLPPPGPRHKRST